MELKNFKLSKIIRRSKFRKGFTLMELLVIVAIIGILSSIVLSSLSSTRERAKDGRRISDIKQIQIALELYYDVNSAYPSSIYTGTPLSTFLKVPSDPGGTDYVYSSSGQDYALAATLQQYNKLLQDDSDTDTSDTERDYNVTP